MQKKVIFSLLFVLLSFATFSQHVGTYTFIRTPHLINFNFKNSKTTYTQGVSTGIGLYRKMAFLELGTFITEDNSHGLYTFFGSTVDSRDLGNTSKLNINWFGEVTNLPSQSEQKQDIWIFTGGICLFPNIQLQKLSLGTPLCFGIAHDEDSFSLNTRFILNVSYLIN